MDAKKLHQLQQSQNVQKKLPLAYQTNIADYRTATHSPVFQQQQQLNYHMSHVPSGSSNTAALTAQYQQSPTTTSSSGPLSPIDIQPQANKLLLKHQVTSGSGGNTSSSAHSSPYHQPSTSSGYPTSSGGTAGNSEQLYQSPTERTYLAAAGRLQASHNPATTLQQQYQQLQQAKLQAQLQTQNEAIQHQHRTFALRQAMNPPVPQGHYHASQSSSMVSSVPQQSVVQQQMASQQQQRAPPSSLTLSNQFQPASGPLKVNQQQQAQHSVIGPQGQQHFHHHPQQQVHRSQEQIYGQHQHQQLQMQLHHQQQLHQQQQHQQQHYHPLQQRSKSDLQTPSGGNDQSPVYIQQNHPGHVVNQACQTQISAVVKTSQTTQNTKTPSSEDSSSASAKSPTHHPVDRKKSSGGSNSSNTQALKSPLTKRPPSSPVTISGWLYKQGSDGLKVWRKRWFVLAEYCLYYYKGPEEEKLLGSILLPSYKVSACLPEDKIYRKYAFKCEHQNMRTYWLAAENPESMVQWVRALSAAAMMQASASGGESSEQPSVSSSSANQSGENSDSGIHTLQSQQSKLSSQGQVTPASDSGKNQATNGNSGGGGGVQPLYANAPPKPRRITDGGYSSPSPEHSIDNERRAHQQQQQQQQHQHQHQFQPSATSRRSGIMSPTLQQMQQQQQQQQYAHTHSGQSRPQHHAIYDTRTGNVSSALRVQQPPTQQYQQQQQSVYNIDHLETQYQQQMSLMNDENSKTSPGSYMDAQMEAQIMQLQQQRAAIGDDIYGERELYMQRLIQQRYPAQAPNYGTNNAERRTPDAYGRSKNRIFSDYEDIYNFTQPGNVGATNVMSAQEALIQEAASYRRPLSPPTYDGHKHVPSIPSLYATNHLEHSSTQNVIGSNSNLRARPAAAIIRPHSADFLEYEARNDIATTDALPTPATTSHLTHMVKPDPVRAPRPKSSLDINRTPDSFYYSEENYAEKMRKSALYLQHPQGQTTLAQPQQAGSYRTATGSSDFLAAPHNGLNTIGYENPYERAYKRNELMQDALINQTGHTSIPRMSRSQMIGAGSHVRSSSTHPHTPQSPTIQQSNLLTAGLTTQQIIQQNEQFLRSASARLPKRTGTFDDEPNSPPPPADASPPPVVGTNNNAPASHLDGERKREESMKRLLEWKQRMLQSPLTRKGAQAHSTALNSNNDNSNGKNNVTNASKLGSNPNILLSSTTVASGAHYPIKKTNSNANNVNVGLQRSRSETHANSGHGTGYNSYSSDDEASISIRNVRNLPRSNLTVKPDATDAQLQHHQQHQQQQLQQPQQQYNNYDQMQKLTNTYYGTAHDTKYAKATTLTDRNARSIGGNSSSRGVGGVGVGGGGGGGDGKNGGGSGIALTNGVYATTSTPLHPSNDGLGMGEYFVSGVGGNGSNHNIYGMHNGYQSIAATQQHQHLPHSLRRAGSRAEIDMLERETSTQIRNLEVSAGDLLSRTHEELVLLLIQLRRQNSNTARNIEQCCSDIHDVQNRLRGADGLSRAESIQRLDYLKQHLLDLERQYEKSKPLVNLVDNMVKLGSLYRNDAQQQRTQQTNQRTEAAALDRLEFNHRIQERRMLQEEQKQWNRLSPNHTELQSKVHQLYQLDQLLQEESGTLQNLQRDKEDLERALGGLRARIQDTNGPPLALEAAKKQQHMLERELSRVHQLLADNSKKLEQTVAGNARLEQELLILRQKLQSTRGSQTALAISDTYASNTTAMLESELKRVQTLVGDMQRQRQELSSAVRQLTENSNKLYQEIGNKEQDGLRVNESSSNNGSIKKRGNTGCWIETDLDSMISVNRTLSDSTMNLSQPLYVDTSTVGTSKLSDFSGSEDVINEATRRSHNSNSSHLYRYNDLSDNLETSGVDSDGFLDTNPFANLTNQEKQEIKTVRIVKRESERRHRDRNERTSLTSSIQNLDQVLEEEHYGHMNGALGGINVGLNSNDDSSQHQSIERSKSLPRAYNNETTVIKSSKHHHHHQHRHKHNNSIYNDYNYGPGQNNQSYDKNSNYSHNRNGQQQALTNGHIVPPREHLNPLANAYFAKQLQEKQKQQQQQQQQQHSQPYTSYARENFHSELRRKTESVQSLNKSLTDLTPFQSEAAKQILSEMSGSASEDTEKVVEKIPSQHKHRRAVPREKRRHYTAPNNVINVKGLETTQTENDMNRNNTNWRARDDLDMEVALRPRLNAPDVVRSALGRGEKISENTIDNLLLAPNKIVIPERYIPENTPELSPEEKKRRQEKVESIKKMLADAPISTANETTATLPPSKLNEEKKQREHLLQLNQILAQQVMQMSKIVAEKAMSKIGNGEQNGVKETDDGRKSVSPNEPLPIYQQRDNYFS